MNSIAEGSPPTPAFLRAPNPCANSTRRLRPTKCNVCARAWLAKREARHQFQLEGDDSNRMRSYLPNRPTLESATPMHSTLPSTMLGE